MQNSTETLTLIPTSELRALELNWIIACALNITDEVMLRGGRILWWERHSMPWVPCENPGLGNPIIDQSETRSYMLHGKWHAMTGRGSQCSHEDRLMACMGAFAVERYGDFVTLPDDILQAGQPYTGYTENTHWYQFYHANRRSSGGSRYR